MPHELTIREDGEAEMFYVGETPWHGLGTKLENPATWEEAIEAAHLDWEVETQSIFRQDPMTGEMKAYPNRFAIVRKDTNQEFDIVSDQYQIVQNRDAGNALNAIVAQGEAMFHTAGSLRGGATVWALVKLPGGHEPVKGDIIEKYVLMSTSHDRSKTLQIATTPIRVICANTLRFALGRASYVVNMKHTAQVLDRAVEAREALQLNDAYYAVMMEGIDRLVRTPMRATEMKEYATAFLNLNPDVEELHTFSRDAHDKLCELFEVGRGQDMAGVRGTAYAALNATTEFLDNHKRVQVARHQVTQTSLEAQDGRLYRSWLGRGQHDRNFGGHALQKFSREGIGAFAGSYVPRKRATKATVAGKEVELAGQVTVL